MKKKLLFVFVILSLFACSTLCYGAEFDGYIVKITNTPESSAVLSALGFDGVLNDEFDGSDVAKLLSDEIDEIESISNEHRLVKTSDEETLKSLVSLGIVEKYEPDYIMELYDYDVTANADFAKQSWVFDAINADAAWNKGLYGNDVRIAVIDSGVYPNADIADNLLPGFNFVDAPAGATDLSKYDVTNTTDYYYHGTFVAGIIAAQCNSSSIVGLSFGAKIVPFRVTDDKTLPMSRVVSAMYKAVDEFDCDVINLSLGSSKGTDALKEVLDYAISKNVIVVAAAGNDGANGYNYPAGYTEAISVANAERSGDTFVIKSSSQVNDTVDIAAPGSTITSLANNSTGTQPRTASGTSFSCPLVAATAAIIKTVKPEMSQSEFEALIKSTANSSYLTSSQGSNYWGAGMLDIEKTLDLLISSDVYVSPTDSVSGKINVTLTNMTNNAYAKSSLIIKEYGDGNVLTKFKIVPVSLAANSSSEIDIASYGFSKNASVGAVWDHVPGDVDGDGFVTLRDAVSIMQYAGGHRSETISVPALDVDSDGAVTLKDALRLMQYASGHLVEII